jgi:hypothetical protein
MTNPAHNTTSKSYKVITKFVSTDGIYNFHVFMLPDWFIIERMIENGLQILPVGNERKQVKSIHAGRPTR